MFTFEFTIEGPPVSRQAYLREGLHAWRDVVRLSAETNWPLEKQPMEGPIQFNIVYYYENISLDTRSIAKPIQDALLGLVFYDNTQITQAHVSKQNLYSSFRVPNLSPVLALALCRGTEFIYVRIDDLSPPETAGLAPDSVDQPIEQLAGEIPEVLRETPLKKDESEAIDASAIPGAQPDDSDVEQEGANTALQETDRPGSQAASQGDQASVVIPPEQPESQPDEMETLPTGPEDKAEAGQKPAWEKFLKITQTAEEDGWQVEALREAGIEFDQALVDGIKDSADIEIDAGTEGQIKDG
jgi:hypothetical protein